MFVQIMTLYSPCSAYEYFVLLFLSSSRNVIIRQSTYSMCTRRKCRCVCVQSRMTISSVRIVSHLLQSLATVVVINNRGLWSTVTSVNLWYKTRWRVMKSKWNRSIQLLLSSRALLNGVNSLDFLWP